VPAAAVIPAPIAYTKVVAVKKLVVEIVSCGVGLPTAVRQARLRGFSPVRVHRPRAVKGAVRVWRSHSDSRPFSSSARSLRPRRAVAAVYFEQIRVLKAG
jgi:hypothetical protein